MTTLAQARERQHAARDAFYDARNAHAKALWDNDNKTFRKPKTKEELIVAILWEQAKAEWEAAYTAFDAIRNQKP